MPRVQDSLPSIYEKLLPQLSAWESSSARRAITREAEARMAPRAGTCMRAKS